ncbi:uncharacterized protein EAE98_001706 [Botrytis deweyae]|uniref:DUF4470 domain-containing protein n=1 Tax=Botrytis deweyae TaxID=2478750 RepID=A0ABQ7IZ26_9HELO|nr:uncharacterized protein EAE98_001706 [Botrytis deweyae]KAF7937392.1 hypothetical protein EAE98_001706 [Botrytis deweyae]
MSSPEDLSKRLREEGNKLYNSRDFVNAIHKYMQAARASQDDPAPLRNLSSAYYESGQYKMCVLFAKKAIQLMNKAATGDKDSAFTKHIQDLEERIRKAENNLPECPLHMQKERRVEILERLARYHASILVEWMDLMRCRRSAGDYVTVGHDNAKSLFDESLALQIPAGETISFFNSGLGDARHFLASLISIAHEEAKGKIPKRRYHFTLNDINKHALTRDLIIFSLLDKLSQVKREQIFDYVSILNTIYFIYASCLMPKWVNEQLQEVIAELSRCLRNGQQPLEWIYLSEADIPSYIQALENWVSGGKVANVFTAKEVMESTISTMDDSIYSNKSAEYWEHIGPYCNKERDLYCATGVLLPFLQAMQKHDPKLADLSLKALHNPRGRESRLFMTHVMTDDWVFNPTMLDWDAHIDIRNPEPRAFLRFDPFNLVSRLWVELKEELPPTEQYPHLFEHIAPFFAKAARAIKSLGSRLKVEIVKGDYIDVAERIHFGLHYDPTQSQALDTGDIGYPRPKDFPSLYHRISLSNVPDYVGGHLTTFLHAMPLLARHPTTRVGSVCLRNSPFFRNMDEFLSEYQLVSSEKMLEQLTGVRIAFKGREPVPLANYTYYCWNQPTESVPLSKQVKARLSRDDLKRWFHGLFLRLAIPMTSDHRLISDNNHMIYSPLNLTILFRQLAHLHCLGYPAHWLLEVLVPLLEDAGMLKTNVRPPSNVPLRPDQVDLKYPFKELCIVPFVPELKTLATLFAPLLPFRIDPNLLYPIDKIHEYTFDLSPLPETFFQPTCLVLLFWSPNGSPSGHFPLELYPSLRPFLDPSRKYGVADHGSEDAAQKIEDWRAKDVIVWSTLNFDIEKQEAKAWMPKQIIAQMVNKEWKCALMRRDLWMIVGATLLSTSGRVRDMVKMGRKWDEGFKEDDDTEKDDDGSNDDGRDDEDALQRSGPNTMDHRMFQAVVEEIFNDSKKLGAANKNIIDGGGAMDMKNKSEDDDGGKDDEDDVDDENDEYYDEHSLD